MSQFLYFRTDSPSENVAGFRVSPALSGRIGEQLSTQLGSEFGQWFVLESFEGEPFEVIFDQAFKLDSGKKPNLSWLVDLVEELSGTASEIVFVYGEVDNELERFKDFAEFQRVIGSLCGENPVELHLAWAQPPHRNGASRARATV